MKKLIFDLQRFTAGFKYADGLATYNDGTNDLFTISGLTGDPSSVATYNAGEHKVTFDNSTLFGTGNVTIEKVNGTEDVTYTLAYTTPAATYAWATANGSKVAKYQRTDYYELDGGVIKYHAQANNTVLAINFTTAPDPAPNMTDWLTVVPATADAAGTITVNKVSGDILPNGFSISSGNYTIALADDAGNTGHKIGEFTATPTAIEKSSTSAIIKGTWSKGYYLNSTAKTLYYKDESAPVTLATVRNLNPEFDSGTTLIDGHVAVASSTITLKAGALNKKTVSITETKAPDGSTTGNFTLALDSGVSGFGGEPDPKNVWEVKGTNATYKNVIPEYYSTNTGKSITYTAQATTKTGGGEENIYGTITGLVLNTPDTASNTKLFDAGDNKLTLSYEAPGGNVTTATAITAAAVSGSTTNYTYTLNGNVLPINTNGSVKLTNAPASSTLVLGATLQNNNTLGSTMTPGQTAETSTWTISSGSATFNAKLKNGYNLTNDNTIIKNAASATSKTLATITGLSSEANASWTTNASTFYTIEGYHETDAPAGADNGTNGGTDDDGAITITLKKAALTNKPVSISSKTDSFKYELALDADAKLQNDANDPGNISSSTNIWVFNGSTATYKRVTPEHWTYDSTTGKVSYHNEEDHNTYATIKGLDSAKLKDLTYSTDGTKVFKDLDSNGTFDSGTDILAIDIIDGSNIKLGKGVLGTSNVTLVNGKQADKTTAANYTLDLITSDTSTHASDTNVVAPDVIGKWWSVATGTTTNTATLHQKTQAGYTVADSTTVKYSASTTDKVLATIGGLSTDVKVLDSNGSYTTVAESSVQLGIAAVDTTTGVAAHTAGVWNAGKSNYDWVNSATQTITLTDAMLAKTKVTLTDKDANDDQAFTLVLASNTATASTVANSWQIGGSTASNSLVYQKYNKGFYTINDAQNAITYTKDNGTQKLFTLTVKDANRDISEYKDDEGELKIDKGTAPAKDWKPFVNIDTDAQTVTLTTDGSSTATGNSVVFTANNSDYQYYSLANAGSSATWSAPAWSTTGTVATLSKVPSAAGYELSEDSKTLSYFGNSDSTTLLKLTGLKYQADATNLANIYDSSTKTVTLTQDLLTNTKVQLTSINKDSYTLELDPTTVRSNAEDGFGWEVTTVNDTYKVVAKYVTKDYYNVSGNNVNYIKEVVKSRPFTITGLSSTSTATSTAFATIKDADTYDTALTDSGTTQYVSFDASTSEVTINESLLPNATDGQQVKISGSGWKLAGFNEVQFTGNGIWTVDNGVATLTMSGTSVTPGYKLTNNGQTLTYVTGDQTLLTITGLDTDRKAKSDGTGQETTTDRDTRLAKYLNDNAAYDDSTKKVTLPQEVLGTKASKVKLVTDKNSVFKDDGYSLAISDEVLDTPTGGYSWEIKNGTDAEVKNVVFKKVTQAYFTPDNANPDENISYTYHKESGAVTQFTLNGVAKEVAKAIEDKDGDTTLTNKTTFTDYITVNTSTGTVALSEDVILHGIGKNGKTITLKNAGVKNYYFESNTSLSTPTYGNATWTTVSEAANTYKMQLEATSAGYELSDNYHKLTYVGQKNAESSTIKHDILQVSGLDKAPVEGTTATFDEFAKTITLKGEVLKPTNISIKSLKPETTYTLALDEEVLQSETPGYAWDISSATSKITAKAVTQEYYASNSASTTFTHKAEKPTSTLFTISGVTTTSVLGLSDKDGDNILNSGTTAFVTFDTSTGKVTIADTSILPSGVANDKKTITLTNSGSNTYSFEDNLTAPVYVDANATWSKTATNEATLQITPENAGYELSNGNRTLTYVHNQARDLMKLSGLTSAIDSATLKSNIEVDITNKRLTLSAGALEGTTKITADKSSGYSLALDSEVQEGIPTETKTTSSGTAAVRVTEDVWQLGAGGNSAYRRTVYPEYYTIDNSYTISHHAAEKTADIFSISGLKSVELNAEGQIAATATSSVPLVQLNVENASNTVVSINDAALATGTTISLSTQGTHTYKFELADGESARTGDVTWEYNSATDKISVIGTYTANKFLVSDDKKSIKAILGTDGSTGQTLATISGINLDSATQGSTTADIDTYLSGKFEFDDYNKTITFKDDSLLKVASTVTISDTDNFYNYKLALDTSEINTNTAKGGSTWDISSAEAVYKIVNEAAYTLNSSTFKSITTTPQSATSTVATVTGLKAIDTSRQVWGAGSDDYAYSIKVKDTGANQYEDAIRINTADSGANSQTVIVSSAVLPDGTATSVVSVSGSGYRIALNPTEDIKTAAEYSIFKANQATGTTTFAITANRNAYYTLNTGTYTSITYTPSATGVAMATLTGLRTATSATNVVDETVFTSTLLNGATVDNDEKTITLANSALSTTTVQFSNNAGGYRLALADEQNTTAADIWEYSSGTATFKNTTPEHYALSANADSITYVAAADTNKYFSISGLNTTTETTKVLSTTTTALGDSYVRAGTGTTAVVEYDGNDTITLHAGALSTSTGTVVSLKDENTTDTKKYQFAFGDDITATKFDSGTVTKLGLSTLGTDELKFNSGTRSVAATVTYEAPIQQGYVLSESNTKVSIADGTGSHKYFTINGLQNINSSTNLTSVITVENDVVTIKKNVLGTSNVTLVDEDAYDDRTFTLALDNEVKTTKDQSNYWTFSGSGTRTTAEYKTGTDAYYTLDGNSITYKAASSTRVLATVTGLKTVDTGVTVDDDQKKITITRDALTDTKVEITGTSDYTFNFTNTNPTYSYKWSYESRTGLASLDNTPSSAKYTLDTSTNKTITYTPATQKTNILTLNNLDSDLATNTHNATTHGDFGSSNGINGIDGIKVVQSGPSGSETLTVTIDSSTLKQSSVNLSGNTTLGYTYKLALDVSSEGAVPTNSTGSTAWEYNKANNGNVTFSYKASIPVHYSLNSTSTTAVFHQSSTNTTYATVMGKATDFNPAIQTAINNYESTSDTTTNTSIIAESKTAIVTAFGNYVDVTGQTVTFKASSTTTKGLTANSATYVTVSTPQVGTGSSAVQYMSQISGTSVVQASGTTKNWSLKGSSLILSTPLTEGYTFNGNKLYYANANANGDKIFTISGLDLTDAKAAMVNYDSTQQAAINNAQALVNSATTVYNTAYQEWKNDRTDADKTAAKNAAADALSASETHLAGVIATAQSTNLGTYMTSARIAVNDTTHVITIAKDLLGTSNVDITNNGDVKYTLATTDVNTVQGAATNQWTFSGGTATLKETKDAFYTLKDASSNTIVYNKPVYGTTVATIKGLATSVYKDAGNDSATAITTGTMVTNTTRHTVTYTTTQSQPFWTDTYVPESKDGVIGIRVDRKTQPTITTTTVVSAYTDNTFTGNPTVTTSTSVSRGSATTALAPSGTWVGGASALSTIEGSSADTRTTIALSSTVLGTTTISLTGTDYKLSIAGAQAPSEVDNSRKWTGSLGGTSAVLTADYQEGWTLDTATNKVTYTAAKDDATLLTLNGIKINITSTDTNLQTAINDAVDALGDNPTAAETRTAAAAATNAFISDWVSNTAVVVGTTAGADGYVPVTVKAAALNETNITAKSGDRTTTYKLVLDTDVANTATARTYSWNGLKYQSLNSAYYSTNTSLGITFNKANNIVTLATLKGIVGSSIPAGAWEEDSDGSGTLTLSATTLGTSTVSLTGDGAGNVRLQLAGATDNTLSTGDVRDQTNGTWVVSGTTAIKKNGYPAFYTLDTNNNKITYTAESGTTKTFATIRGLNKEFTGTITDNNGEVELTAGMLGTTNITMTDGNVTDDNKDYKLKLATGINGPNIHDAGWNTNGVNTTLKANVDAGWNLDANSTTAIYTPDASNKALATFVFNSVGLDETGTNVASLSGKVYTLSNIGANNMITIRTNPGNLDFKVEDTTNFNGTAEAKTTLVGSSVGEGIEVTGVNQIVSGLGGDDVISLSGANGASGASVNGGVGADNINIGTGAKNVTILGDAANDTIQGNTTDGNNIFYGGAGDDSINLGVVAGNVTINGETGNDEINVGASANVFGGAGADKITLASSGAVSIYGEAANDTIKVAGNAENTTINGGAGADSITVGGTASGSILGEAGNDEIYIKGTSSNITIDGGAGSDIITLEGAMTGGLISGDIGNDTIVATGGGTISGGAGNDSIVVGNGATGLTVYGGAGNDTVDLNSGAAVTYYYANGDGNDTVTGYTDDDTFKINSGAITSASVSGRDLILKIGSYKVTLKEYSDSDNTFSYTSGSTSTEVSIAGTASDLIYDNNGLLADDNLMTPNDISELVSTNSVTEYHVGNMNNNIMAPDQILSEGDLISYGNQQKKNNK